MKMLATATATNQKLDFKISSCKGLMCANDNTYANISDL